MHLFDTFVTSYQEPFCPFPYTYFDIVFKFNLKKRFTREPGNLELSAELIT